MKILSREPHIWEDLVDKQNCTVYTVCVSNNLDGMGIVSDMSVDRKPDSPATLHPRYMPKVGSINSAKL